MNTESNPILKDLPFDKKLINIRNKLHQIPEIGFQEHKTTQFLHEYIAKFPELKIHTFPFPGLLVEYTRGKGGYTLFRSDIDALPVTETTGCSFSSQHPGMMHACGHDIHMTILLGLAEDVARTKIRNNILFLFQPAEEGKGGAQRIIELGILDNFDIVEAYALHVHPDLPVDTISSCPGTIFGIPQELDIVFQGKSAHAANPQKGDDAIMAAAHFLSCYNSVLVKSLPPNTAHLAHFGKIGGGDARNIVADSCRIQGTLRAFSRDSINKIESILSKTARAVADVYHVKADLETLGSYEAVKNSVRLYDKLKQSLPSEVKFKRAEPALTGEDFGFFTTLYDGLLFWIGGNCVHDLHSPSFLADEKAIETGLRVFRSLIHSDK